MKKQLLFGLFGAAGVAALAGLSACSDTFSPTADGEGKLLVSVDLNKAVVASPANKQSAPESRADAQAITASDLTLKISNETGSFSRELAVADFTEPVTVPVGSYSLEAFYGSVDEEGFEKPCYKGTSTFSVQENQATPVSVTASLANCMVRVEMSEMFRTYFASYSVTLRSELGNEIAYPADETRSVYLKPGQITTTISITKQNGVSATLEPKSFTAEPRHSYVLKFDVNSGEAGNGELNITYDPLCEVEDVIIDLSDDILTAPAPTLSYEGFTEGTPITQLEGLDAGNKATVTAIARAGVQAVTVTTSSASLLEQGWPAEIDVIGGDAATLATMESLGLRRIGTTNPGNMVFLDFSNVLKNIRYKEGADNTSTFTVQVRDKNSRVAEAPVSFSVNIEKLELSVNRVASFDDIATELEMYLNFNGPDISGLKIQCRNERNTWDTLPITTCEVAAGEEHVYRVVLTVPSTDQDIALRLTIGTLQKDVVIKHSVTPYTLQATANGAFAKEAFVTLAYDASVFGARRRGASRSAEEPENVTFQLSTDNGTTWANTSAAKVSGNYYKLTGLTPTTTYLARAICEGYTSKRCSFTTEEALELEDGGLEIWTSEKGSDNYNKYYPGGNWNTLNLLTTSFTGAQDTYAYCNNSGTRDSSDSHSGKAALIQTVGWGQNAATISGTEPKHVTAGELYLGNYNNGAVYGISFVSRPKSVSFWYKYTAKNSADYGRAWMKVLDASGNVIAEKQLDLPAQSSYTQQTMECNYSAPYAKAASLQITFVSSGYPGIENQKSKSWISYPRGWATTGSGDDIRFIGSSLYIDDVVLNY